MIDPTIILTPPPFGKFPEMDVPTPYGVMRACFNGSILFDTVFDNPEPGSSQQRPLIINSVPYTLSIHLQYTDGKWQYLFQRNTTLPSRYDSVSAHRADWCTNPRISYSQSDPSPAAWKKIESLIADVLIPWLNDKQTLIQAGKKAAVSHQLDTALNNLKKKHQEFEDAQDKARNLWAIYTSL